MKAWIYSIVGIVVLTVLLDLVLEEGETKKYIRGIFSLLAVIVIASPIPQLLNGSFDVGDFSGQQTAIVSDADYLRNLNVRCLDYYAEETEARLAESGYADLSVLGVLDTTSTEYKILKVSVTKKYGITADEPNTYNTELIIKIVSEGMRAKKEVVIVDV